MVNLFVPEVGGIITYLCLLSLPQLHGDLSMPLPIYNETNALHDLYTAPDAGKLVDYPFDVGQIPFIPYWANLETLGSLLNHLLPGLSAESGPR